MTLCDYFAVYAASSTLGCAVSARIIVGLKEVIRDKEHALWLEDRESAGLRNEIRYLKASITAEPAPHVHSFDTGHHPILVDNAIMAFCSEPGCYASRLISTNGRPFVFGLSRAVVEHDFWDEDFEEGR